jgi:hypothetical protein
MSKHHQHQPDFALPPDTDKLVKAIAREVAECLRPAPAAVLLTFRVVRVRRKNNMNICDLIVSWVPPASGVVVQHFAASIVAPTAGALPVSVTQDVGPSVTTLTVKSVPDGASVSASVIEDNSQVPSAPLTGSFSVGLTAADPATGMAFAITNVRPDDGSPIAIESTVPAAPATTPPTVPPADSSLTT